MKKKLFFLILALVFFVQPLYAQTSARFPRLQSRLSSVANANYGRKVYPGHKIGITVVDVKTGARVSVNGSSVFPAASIIKIPIMAYLFNASDSGTLTLGKRVKVDDSHKQPGAGVIQYLKPNYYTLWSLCRYMISISDNTATYVLALMSGKENVNSYMRRIGLSNTRLLDETALVERPRPNYNRTTPNDIAYLLLRIQRGAGFSKASRADMIKFMRNQKYVFGIPRTLPKNFSCANKTGKLTNVLHDAAIVYSPRGSYVLCVFTQGFKNDTDARIVMNRVSRIVAEYYR